MRRIDIWKLVEKGVAIWVMSSSRKVVDIPLLSQTLALSAMAPSASITTFSPLIASLPTSPRSSSLLLSSNTNPPSSSMPPLKIAAIAGSLRKESIHKGLVRAAIEIAQEHLFDVLVEPLVIAHLPLLNMDLEKDGQYPDEVAEFRAKVLLADAILFASPEYNYSLTAPLKNAIDWASRPPNVWADKPAAIVSAGGAFGGGRAQYHLRQVGVFLDLHFLSKPELFVRAFDTPRRFDEGGNLVDSVTKQRLKELLIALRTWTLRLRGS